MKRSENKKSQTYCFHGSVTHENSAIPSTKRVVGHGKRATFAFDIDGTCTDLSSTNSDHLKINFRWVPGLVEAFRVITQENIQLLFVTGRTLAWSYELLKSLDVPYIVASLNGAETLLSPERRILYQEYIPGALVKKIIALFDEPMVIYSQTGIFYANSKGHALEAHLEKRKTRQKEVWHPLTSIDDLKDVLTIRYFFTKQAALARGGVERLSVNDKWESSCMQDSFDPAVSILQFTASGVDKALPIRRLQLPQPLIAFGDDYNDIPLFKIANKSFCHIASPTALRDWATGIFTPEKLSEIVIEASQL